MKPNPCGLCHQEIRLGWRDGKHGWLHREAVDHEAVLGTPFTEEMRLEVERQRNLPRTRTVTRSKKVGGEKVTWEEEETYTVAELDLKRWRKSKKYRDMEALEADDDEEEEEEVAPLPPVEVHCHPVEVESFPPRSGIRQICNTVLKAEGWEIRRLTHSRGPYLGSKGECLSISDTIILGASKAPELDGSRHIAVASWRDGKFDFAYVGAIISGNLSPRRVNSTEMKDWIKGDLPDAMPQPGE